MVVDSMECVVVSKLMGEFVRKLLLKNSILDKRYRITIHNDKLYIPIVDSRKASNLLEEHGVFFNIVECSPPLGKASSKLEHIPAYDIVGDVVIVRESVIKEWGRGELVSVIKSVYPRVKSIYVKKGTETRYRLSRLELLWGMDVDEVVHREYGLRFYILLHKVYYNPRLSTEHRLVANEVVDGEFVVDMFSGIGGFSLHIACLRNALVLANDLNPYAIECLLRSVELNKKKLKGSVIASLNDAWSIPSFVYRGRADRIIANLPRGSLDFIEVYNYLSHTGTVLYLYILGSSSKDVVDRVSNSLVDWRVTGVRKVLDYSPYRYVFRVKLSKI